MLRRNKDIQNAWPKKFDGGEGEIFAAVWGGEVAAGFEAQNRAKLPRQMGQNEVASQHRHYRNVLRLIGCASHEQRNPES